MSMNVGGRATGPKADINITPLVDVVLVLLIIFMVVTPLMQQGIEVKLPDAQHVVHGKEESPLVVTVTANQVVYVDKTPVGEGQLEDAVARELAGLPNRTVLLKGDKRLHWAAVRKPMDLIRQAQERVHSQAPGVSLVTEKPDDGSDAQGASP